MKGLVGCTSLGVSETGRGICREYITDCCEWLAMSDAPLPLDRFTAETHMESLDGLVARYEHEDEPIHYKKAASDVSEATSSSCLRYFNEIGLIEAEKQGVYVPSDAVIDFFTKVRESRESAVQEIYSCLRKDPIFKEATFHIDDDDIELRELAEKTAGGLDINKDAIPQIERAIEIFEELEVLAIDEDGFVSLNGKETGDTSTVDQDNTPPTDSTEQQTESDDNSDLESIDLDELALAPTRGDPKSIHDICQVLRAGGTWTTEELEEDTNFASRTLRGHLRYGEELGFVKRGEDGISNTQSGFDLGFEEKFNEKTAKLFLQGVLESDFYVTLLQRCLSRAETTQGDVVITSRHCEHELRTSFGFTEESESTVNTTINTFLQTLEAAGQGEYIVGRRGNETRIVLKETKADDLEQKIHTQSTEQPVEGPSEFRESEEPETETQDAEEDIEENSVRPGKAEKDGPPLRISSFRIRNFRNIQDTGEIRLEPITTFIGKNESGKTSTLEAIFSFEKDGEYADRDICNDINYESKEDFPVISLTFEISEQTAKDHYSMENISEDFPVEYRLTKYADGHIENETDLDITPPSPEIVYYNEYDLISDVLYFDETSGKEDSTFWNLLKIGDLTEEEIKETKGREHDQALENAENRIERQLNEGWSQKDIRINLRYSGGENCLRLYIQDEIRDKERELTHPSQRSEGFQWFFSFYVNMLAETEEETDGHKILLLDDPAVHLHPSGKQDWLVSLEKIAQEEQVLYTSHSPYLIAKQYPARIRTVEDSRDGTQISSEIFDADTGTLEPLRNALGIDMSASPFVSEGQLLVEGPSEYYILSAVGTYMEDVLDRGFLDWNKISLMPVRGANDVIGKASWLESENLEYVILLDSDEKGRRVQERIQEHQEHIDNNRVQLLSRRPHDRNVVIEDIFDPEVYITAANEFYLEFTKQFENNFEPFSVEQIGPNKWEIGREEYDGKRIDKILVSELERQDIAEELENEDGEIELAKRPIAEILSEKINNGDVAPDDLDYFNEVLGNVDSKLDL